jgi:hypothetical protein
MLGFFPGPIPGFFWYLKPCFYTFTPRTLSREFSGQ